MPAPRARPRACPTPPLLLFASLLSTLLFTPPASCRAANTSSLAPYRPSGRTLRARGSEPPPTNYTLTFVHVPRSGGTALAYVGWGGKGGWTTTNHDTDPTSTSTGRPSAMATTIVDVSRPKPPFSRPSPTSPTHAPPQVLFGDLPAPRPAQLVPLPSRRSQGARQPEIKISMETHGDRR